MKEKKNVEWLLLNKIINISKLPSFPTHSPPFYNTLALPRSFTLQSHYPLLVSASFFPLLHTLAWLPPPLVFLFLSLPSTHNHIHTYSHFNYLLNSIYFKIYTLKFNFIYIGKAYNCKDCSSDPQICVECSGNRVNENF